MQKNPHCSMAMSAEHRSKFAALGTKTLNKQTHKQTNKFFAIRLSNENTFVLLGIIKYL